MTRLIDYRMHDGRNAWTCVHLRESAPFSLLEQGAKFVTRLSSPLAGDATPPGPDYRCAQITADKLETDPALISAVVFESAHPAQLDPANNTIRSTPGATRSAACRQARRKFSCTASYAGAARPLSRCCTKATTCCWRK